MYRLLWDIFVSSFFQQSYFSLNNYFYRVQVDIEHWFSEQWKIFPAPFYGSVDLRNSGVKLAPVDMNLFPGGFNNLSEEGKLRASLSLKKMIVNRYSHVKKILLIPENHTKNMFYLENVYALKHILIEAGIEVRVASSLSDFKEVISFKLSDEKILTVEPLLRKGASVVLLDGFVPDLILLNNDLSGGIPTLLEEVILPIVPLLNLGWHKRRKREHFELYDAVVTDFSDHFKIDPWIINPYFSACQDVDFKIKIGFKKQQHLKDL